MFKQEFSTTGNWMNSEACHCLLCLVTRSI